MKAHKSLFRFAVLAVLFLQCKEFRSDIDKIDALLDLAMEAHGGKDQWDSVQRIAYTKEIKLFLEDGSLEKEVVQYHENDFERQLVQMDWEEEGVSHQARSSQGNLELRENGRLIQEEERLKKAAKSLDAALYVFWQPRKLLDEQATFTYGGERTLFDETEVVELQVSYPDSEDRWYYFFDKTSHLVHATGVWHNGRMSLIINEEVETETGLFLNKKRSSYFTTEEFEPQYLRASYRYTMDEFQMKGQRASQGLLRAEKQRGAHVFRLRDTTGLDAVRDMNIEWITLVPWGFQDSIHTGEITHHYGDTSDRQQRDSFWIDRIQRIRKKGFKVFLKPHVWLEHTANGEWRQHIYPRDAETWKQWKTDYNDFIQRFARIAEASGAEMFCVGTEFTRLALEQPVYWKSIIRKIRKIYKGELTYAANWHKEYNEISFWSELDYIGVQAYFPLIKTENPDAAEIAAGWDRHLPALEKMHQQLGRPILFTEMGYRSIPTSAMRPWEWIEDTGYEGLYSPMTQAYSYRAFFDRVWEQPWFAGVHIWQLRADYFNKKDRDLNFTPQFKPASREITYGFRPVEDDFCASVEH